MSLPKRVAISVGPQYGTVGPSFIKGAALGAIRASEIDVLGVLAFEFDPQTLGATDDIVATDQVRWQAAAGVDAGYVAFHSAVLVGRTPFGFRSPEALVALAMLDLGGLCPLLPGRAAA